LSKVICIAGESGSGKTTSMRTLPPDETYYIDADLKGLSWKGWRGQYNEEKHNYIRCSEPIKIQKVIENINEKGKHIKYIIIDTLNSVMTDDEMKRSKEKGYDKWIDLAACVWDMIAKSYTYREDLTIIFICHTQTETDESGYMFSRIKTNGKKLNKLTLESRFTTVLFAKGNEGKYVFETRAKNSTAKTPLGAFEEDEIENDMMKVIKALEEY